MYRVALDEDYVTFLVDGVLRDVADHVLTADAGTTMVFDQTVMGILQDLDEEDDGYTEWTGTEYLLWFGGLDYLVEVGG